MKVPLCRQEIHGAAGSSAAVPLPKPLPAPESSREGGWQGGKPHVIHPAPLQKPTAGSTKPLLAVSAGQAAIDGFVPMHGSPCLADRHWGCAGSRRSLLHRHLRGMFCMVLSTGTAQHGTTKNAWSMGARPWRTRQCRKAFVNLGCDP